jgi:hypothetical protein
VIGLSTEEQLNREREDGAFAVSEALRVLGLKPGDMGLDIHDVITLAEYVRTGATGRPGG